MSNTPITLTRECIRDTYLAKRQAHGKLDGLILGVYNQNMRILRSGQLRPWSRIDTKTGGGSRRIEKGT